MQVPPIPRSTSPIGTLMRNIYCQPRESVINPPRIGAAILAIAIVAPIYPIARRLHAAGNRVVSIHGARSKGLLFWEDKIAAVSHEHIITTDDGTYGRKGLVTEPLKEILGNDREKKIGCVYAIGPAVMMKFCALTTKPFGVRTIASLNSVMVDGTGMCGGCRVDIGGKTLFTCVDGPEFDAHAVDWDTLMKRQKIYITEEKCSLDRYIEEAGIK